MCRSKSFILPCDPFSPKVLWFSIDGPPHGETQEGRGRTGKRVRSQGRATRRAGPPDNKGKKTKTGLGFRGLDGTRWRRRGLCLDGKAGRTRRYLFLVSEVGWRYVSTHAWNSGGQ